MWRCSRECSDAPSIMRKMFYFMGSEQFLRRRWLLCLTQQSKCAFHKACGCSTKTSVTVNVVTEGAGLPMLWSLSTCLLGVQEWPHMCEMCLLLCSVKGLFTLELKHDFKTVMDMSLTQALYPPFCGTVSV